jgi:hypothetical protein
MKKGWHMYISGYKPGVKWIMIHYRFVIVTDLLEHDVGHCLDTFNVHGYFGNWPLLCHQVESGRGSYSGGNTTVQWQRLALSYGPHCVEFSATSYIKYSPDDRQSMAVQANTYWKLPRNGQFIFTNIAWITISWLQINLMKSKSC